VRGKKPPALSAGRVQSVALRLVVERDREINAFTPEEFWTLDAELQAQNPGPGAADIPAAVPGIPVSGGSSDQAAPANKTGKPTTRKSASAEPSADRPVREGRASGGKFKARLVQIAGKEPEMLKQPQIQAIMDDLQKAVWQVSRVDHKQERRMPYPPFTTSTLQQAASARMSWNPKKTMKIAQELFEGVSLGAASIGLITYMRTDSLAVAPEAQQAARETIQKYWPQALPDKPPIYKTKVANAQEAHEAIRPTGPERTPKAVREFLSPDQNALYEIIWRRFIASQMKPAIYNVTLVDFPLSGTSGQRYLFRATGRVLVEPGFLGVYGVDDDDQSQENRLPNLQSGDRPRFLGFLPEKHMTEPPRRFSQASLIRELEKRGLGRPSTYASIVETLLEREYVTAQQGRSKTLQATPVGMQVLDYLIERFPDVFDYTFTARMEEQLDEIAGGALRWQGVLDEFWKTLGPRV
jgi:DNA topoisomerase-1